MRLEILRTGLLVLVSLFFALPITAQDEADQLLDLLANPPEDGLLIVELEIPGPMYGLYYILVNVSTGEYYDFDDAVYCAGRMPSSFHGIVIVAAYCESNFGFYLIEDGQVKELLLPEDSGVYIDGQVLWTPNGYLSFIGGSRKDNESDTDIYIWDGIKVQDITQNAVAECCMEWSPDGKLAFASGNKDSDRDIMIWDGTKTQTIWPHHDEFYEMAWSPDGRLAIASENELYIWNGTTVLKVISTPRVNDLLEWSSDGKLAFQSYDKNGHADIYVWDGQQTIKVSENPAYIGSAVWGPDNQLAFVAPKDHRNNIYIWQDGVLTQPIPQDIQSYIKWNRDGRLAFVVDNDSVFSVYIWDGHNISLITTYSEGGIFEDLMWVDAP